MKLVGVGLGAMVAVVIILVVAQFIAGSNTAVLDSTTLLIVNNVTVFLGIGLLIYIAYSVFGKGGGKGL